MTRHSFFPHRTSRTPGHHIVVLNRPIYITPSNQIRTMASGNPTSKMLAANPLKQIFTQASRPAMGVWQMLPGANISRILARSGADWVMVDCEHGNIDGRCNRKYGGENDGVC